MVLPCLSGLSLEVLADRPKALPSIWREINPHETNNVTFLKLRATAPFRPCRGSVGWSPTSHRRLYFGPACMGFVVDKVALEDRFLQELQFKPVNVVPRLLLLFVDAK